MIKKEILSGGIIVYPTDTLYGLGCDPANGNAVARVAELKGRSRHQPVSVAFHSYQAAKAWLDVTPAVAKEVKKLLPGPVTLILKASGAAPPSIVFNGTIGLRVPDDERVLGFLKECGPLTATSANRHGEKAPAALSELSGNIRHAVNICVDGGFARYAKPSTVIDLSSGKPQTVREGAKNG
ncbi:MAG: threonylcarbamoyl-AMP synthase [Euryarchaeota archaeon]|nr:threonylcarbamoyl-AMP synthase [Euryarchaeota archaeon]